MWKAFHQRWNKLADLRSTWFDLCLAAPWSSLTLLNPASSPLADERLLDLLDALVKWWPELDSVGPRYSIGSAQGEELWAIPSSIQYALARPGLDGRRVDEPLGPDGLAGVVKQTPGWRIREHLAEGRVADAEALLRGLDGLALCATAHHFMAAGHRELGISIVREAAARHGAPGHLARWVARYAESPETVRASFLAAPSNHDWQRLKELGGEARAEGALEELANKGLLDVVFWVRVWDRDGEKAVAAWDLAVARGHDLSHAAASLADLIVETRPQRAADLFVLAARALLPLKNKTFYRQAAAHVRRARDVLIVAGRREAAIAMTSSFRRENARRTALIAALDKAEV
jgi:hypothetical protein